jgi:hypothetical protein
MAVITRDFGSQKRTLIRRFAEQLVLEALHEKNIAKNPLPYLERASERIFKLEQMIFEALTAARCDAAHADDPNAAAHEALLRCRAILERACFELGISDDTTA